MRAEIISIGTEILLADIQDTNSRFIASNLPALGIDLYYMHQIGDNLGRLQELIATAMDRSDLVLCTGGLGPTEDDITREAIAAAVGEEPTIVPELEANLRAFFKRRGYPMPEKNVKQATVIPSGEAIPNPRGTAPGWWVEKDGTILVAMPGPPAEMTGMWDNEVAPRLRERSTGTIIVSRTLKTIGIGEGTVDDTVGPLLTSTNPTIGVYAKRDGVHLRVTAKANTKAEASALIQPAEDRIRELFGSAVWGADDDTLQASVGALLKQQGLTIAVMESCTGGLLASTLTDVPGSSEYFKGGLVTYSEATKRQYGVPAHVIEQYGVVSEETAAAMATAVRSELGADIGVGVTGVAGPDPHGGQPVGTTIIALESPAGTASANYVFAQTREVIKARAVTTALLLVRRAALGELSP
ncbi:MAG: competence/damage-inducible protein A [Chloroflexi bacterium]|nr:competence/damage-inducible protein A [Chloroflexota bacterium]